MIANNDARLTFREEVNTWRCVNVFVKASFSLAKFNVFAKLRAPWPGPKLQRYEALVIEDFFWLDFSLVRFFSSCIPCLIQGLSCSGAPHGLCNSGKKK